MKCQLDLNNFIRFLDLDKISELSLDKLIVLLSKNSSLLIAIVINPNTLDNQVVIESGK